MKQLLIGIFIGLACSACCNANNFLNSTPFKIVLTERYFVNTTTVTTEEGVYRIFTFENKNGGGITAVKIK